MPRLLEQITPDAFPQPLREIPDRPSSLYIDGALPKNRTYLAVIGSRVMSMYGKRTCEMLIEGLSGLPVCIVSGLALGIDGIAHQSAIRAGLPTVAVLPSGLSEDVLYPYAHRTLAKNITEAGGALVSEYAPNTKPTHTSFAARNRIIAGLSQAVLIIEAAERSGTLITARLALEYNRDVLAVPHALSSELGKGVNTLIHRGALLIRNAEDIANALGITPETQQKETIEHVSAEEMIVYKLLTEPLERDELHNATELSEEALTIVLSKLLLKGLIIEHEGKIVRV